MKNGVLFADEIPVENNVDYIAVTDTEVIKGRRSEVNRLSQGEPEFQQVRGAYFRSPLTVDYTQSILLDENGCEAGQTLQGGECAYECTGLLSSGDKCLRELGRHMHGEAERYAVCDEGYVYTGDGENCGCGDKVERRTDGVCVDECGANEYAKDQICVCVESAFADYATDVCTLRDDCARILVRADGEQSCLAEGVCDKEQGLRLSEDGKTCVSTCEHVYREYEDEVVCVKECDENEDEVDGQCVCTRDGTFVDVATGECTREDTCSKIAVYDDGAECLHTETCRSADLKSDGGKTCVEKCRKYYYKDDGEYKCTGKCKAFYKGDGDGLCKLSGGAVAGLVVGLVAGVAIITVLTMWLCDCFWNLCLCCPSPIC